MAVKRWCLRAALCRRLLTNARRSKASVSAFSKRAMLRVVIPLRSVDFTCYSNHTNTIIATSYRPGGAETICPGPPTAVRLAADLRPSADGSAVRTRLSCRQPACL